MHGHNPLCGDKLTVYLALEGDRIADIGFEGRGCAISIASASLMTEVLKGKTLAEAETLYHAFHARVTGGNAPEIEVTLEVDNERLLPLEGVKAYPVRVKCATLAWHTVGGRHERRRHREDGVRLHAGFSGYQTICSVTGGN